MGCEGISLILVFSLMQHEFICYYIVAGGLASASARERKTKGPASDTLNKQPINQSPAKKRKTKKCSKRRATGKKKKKRKSGNMK